MAFVSGNEDNIWKTVEESRLEDSDKEKVIGLAGRSNQDVMLELRKIFGLMAPERVSHVEYIEDKPGKKSYSKRSKRRMKR